jgi:hypothetical protein
MLSYLSSKKLYDTISKNSKYYDTFTHYDWKARNVKNYDEYMLKVYLSVADFSDTDLKKLSKAVDVANIKIECMTEEYKSGWGWLNWDKLMGLKWVIGCVKGDDYEGGMPHTVGNTIILSKEILKMYDILSLACLLIHEKIHIYQRKYPNDVKKYMKLNGFKIYCKKMKRDLFRANPDLNQYIYEKRGEIYSLSYKNNGKISISNVVNRYGKKVTKKEHPYEEMAYFIEKICKKC